MLSKSTLTSSLFSSSCSTLFASPHPSLLSHTLLSLPLFSCSTFFASPLPTLFLSLSHTSSFIPSLLLSLPSLLLPPPPPLSLPSPLTPSSLSYYQLEETDSKSVNSFLSKIVETSLSTLQTSYCITVEEDDRTLQPLSLGCIASYYYLHHTTVKLFKERLHPQSSFEDLLLLLSVSGSETSGLCAIQLHVACISL